MCTGIPKTHCDRHSLTSVSAGAVCRCESVMVWVFVLRRLVLKVTGTERDALRVVCPATLRSRTDRGCYTGCKSSWCVSSLFLGSMSVLAISRVWERVSESRWVIMTSITVVDGTWRDESPATLSIRLDLEVVEVCVRHLWGSRTSLLFVLEVAGEVLLDGLIKRAAEINRVLR